MASKKDYKLVPKSVPARRRSSFYKDILDDFLDSGQESVLVDGTDRKPVTLVQGLRKALDAEGVEGVKVLQRKDDTYLVRSEK